MASTFYKSHVTQKLLNYFDSNDSRVREHPTTLDAQLFTLPATEIDNMGLRLSREVNRTMEAPCNIDNNGVYYGFNNNSINLTTISTVTGTVGSTPITFTLYDDTLPIPSVITNNSTLPATGLLTTFTSTGSNSFIIQNTVGLLPMPAKLKFYLDKIVSRPSPIVISIKGQIYPQSIWQKYQITTTEKLTITEPGEIISLNKWTAITNITVRGLQSESTISVYLLNLEAPYKIDPYRYYVPSNGRSTQLNRYWSVDKTNNLITESVITSQVANPQVIQSYRFTQDIVDIAIEPFTYGLFAVNNNTLFYADRREPMPSNMSSTIITKDPIYSLAVYYDDGNPGPFTRVNIVPKLVPLSANAFQYRLTMVDPTGSKIIILPDGSMTTYSPNAGWRATTPKPVNIVLGLQGTYTFYIEGQDTFGNKSIEAFPYGNFAFTPLKTLDLSSVSTTINGIAFDDDGKLWVSDANNMHQIGLTYYGYIIDPTTNNLYLTVDATNVGVS